MKSYTIVYLFNPDFEASIGMLREKQGHPALVDCFPAHLTIKRRFDLVTHEEEKKLIDIVGIFKAQRVGIKFDEVIKLGDVVALKTKEEKVIRMHGYFLNSLKMLGVDPSKYESNDYLPHITLWRGIELKQLPKIEELHLPSCETKKLCLYEIDPTSNRAFAKKIVCVSAQ
jgi:2'-5' RNA ligase